MESGGSEFYFLKEAIALSSEIKARSGADLVSDPTVVLLEGDLGAGKTTFAQTFLGCFGIKCTDVQSPTFLKVIDHRLPAGGRALHMDLYRVDDAEGVQRLALEAFEDVRLWVIEWPGVFEDRLAENPTRRSHLGMRSVYRLRLALDEQSGNRSVLIRRE